MICPNPYCPNPTSGMRSPTAEERNCFRKGVEEETNKYINEVVKPSDLAKSLSDTLDKLDRKEITLQICRTCEAWVAEMYNNAKVKIQEIIPSPFKFNVGDQVKVTLEGKHCGMVGVIARRMRWFKLIMPPPPPENIYYVLFAGDSKDYGYGETNLVSARRVEKYY